MKETASETMQNFLFLMDRVNSLKSNESSSSSSSRGRYFLNLACLELIFFSSEFEGRDASVFPFFWMVSSFAYGIFSFSMHPTICSDSLSFASSLYLLKFWTSSRIPIISFSKLFPFALINDSSDSDLAF